MDILGILSAGLREAFGPQAAYYALLVIGLNVHFGYTGLMNFGQAGFAMMGAYGVGIFTTYFGWSTWAAIPMGLLAGLLFALLLGLPTLRLRGDYFAITTIAASEVLRRIISSSWAAPVTGGASGLNNAAPEFAAANPFDRTIVIFRQWSYLGTSQWSMLTTWGVAAIAVVLVWLLMRSPWGRVLRSIREDEDAARSLGKNVVAYKLQALTLGGLIGTVGGIMVTLQRGAVDQLAFEPRTTFYAYAALIIGGAGSIMGPVLGSMAFWFLFTFFTGLLGQLSRQGYLPDFGPDGPGTIVLALVGLAIILFMIYRPQGVMGNRRELMLND